MKKILLSMLLLSLILVTGNTAQAHHAFLDDIATTWPVTGDFLVYDGYEYVVQADGAAGSLFQSDGDGTYTWVTDITIGILTGINGETIDNTTDGTWDFGVANIVVGGVSGSLLNIKSITEEVTIGVAAGNTPAVVTTGDLAPAGSLIIGVVWRVTDAPGGGAATIDIGRTSAGNLDEFTDGASCDVLGETGTNLLNGDTAHTGVQRNVAADTLTLTTDADVTDDEMKVRIVVFYRDLTVPTE